MPEANLANRDEVICQKPWGVIVRYRKKTLRALKLALFSRHCTNRTWQIPVGGWFRGFFLGGGWRGNGVFLLFWRFFVIKPTHKGF